MEKIKDTDIIIEENGTLVKVNTEDIVYTKNMFVMTEIGLKNGSRIITRDHVTAIGNRWVKL